MRLCIYSCFLLFLMTMAGCEQESEFVPLFNGTDLEGWVNVNGAPNTWTVRDSMIVCTGVPTGVLRTTEHYENFILELEWRHLYPNGNAGLFVYSDPLPVRGQPFTRSVECQIMDGNHGDVFAIQGATFVPDRPHPQGWMRCLPNEERANPTGSWNHYRVESRDGAVKLHVNGKEVSGGYQSIPRKGYICLESEGSEVHFRNIRIKKLPSSNPPPEEVAGFDEGFTSLYNGLDLSGWKADSTTRWSARDWRLQYDADDADQSTSLWTTSSYADFELILDWRFFDENPTADAPESGIYLRGSLDHKIQIAPTDQGSGGVEARSDMRPPASKADRAVGEWNRYVIRLNGSELRVELNGTLIQDHLTLSDVPAQGPVALVGGPSIQFANIYLKPL